MTVSNKYTIRSGSIKLSVETFGEGEPIIYAHGLMGNRYFVQDQLMQLSKKYKIITYDARGHCESTPITDPGLYKVSDMVKDMKNILDHLNIKQVIVGGESMGAATALIFALKWPKQVKALILTAPSFGDKKNPEVEEILEFVNSIANEGIDLTLKDLSKEWGELGASYKVMEQLERLIRSHSIESIIAAVKATKEWIILKSFSTLKSIDFPVQIFAWEDDPLHPIELAKNYQKSIDKANLKVIPHFFKLYDDPTIFGNIFSQSINKIQEEC